MTKLKFGMSLEICEICNDNFQQTLVKYEQKLGIKTANVSQGTSNMLEACSSSTKATILHQKLQVQHQKT